MDRYWLLTWTTYGNWLPGDLRGFVGQLRDEHGLPYIHNLPGTPYNADITPLKRAMRATMRGNPIRRDRRQADVVISQFQETAAFRGWLLLAAAIMVNHVHLVVGVSGDPEPEKLLHDFKSYASRVLNKAWGKPSNGTWWTESGSKRKLPDLRAAANAVQYLRDQEYPLVIYVNESAASGVSYDPGN